MSGGEGDSGPRPERPQRRRRGGRRRGPARPQQAPAQPERPSARPEPPRGRDRRGPRTRADRTIAPADAFSRDRRTRRGGRGRAPRSPDDIRPGTSCLILVDAREGEPDRSGSPAVFEGFFDFETGELRHLGTGIPRLRIGDERLWGFECWWRVDTDRTGLTEGDREDIESSKRLLRGLLRDSRRSTRVIR